MTASSRLPSTNSLRMALWAVEEPTSTPSGTLTAYANGERVRVNHGDRDAVFEGTRLPAGDWVLVR